MSISSYGLGGVGSGGAITSFALRSHTDARYCALAIPWMRRAT